MLSLRLSILRYERKMLLPSPSGESSFTLVGSMSPAASSEPSSLRNAHLMLPPFTRNRFHLHLGSQYTGALNTSSAAKDSKPISIAER